MSGIYNYVFNEWRDVGRTEKRSKRYWEADMPKKGKWDKSNAVGVNIASTTSPNSVLLETIRNEKQKDEVMQWIKSEKLCRINHYWERGNLVVTFRNGEEAMYCKLTWGGDQDEDKDD